MSDNLKWDVHAIKLDSHIVFTDGRGTEVALTGDLKILGGHDGEHLRALQIRPFISGEGGGHAGRYVDFDITFGSATQTLVLPLPTGGAAEFTCRVDSEYDQDEHVLLINLMGENIRATTSQFRVCLPKLQVTPSAEQTSAHADLFAGCEGVDPGKHPGVVMG